MGASLKNLPQIEMSIVIFGILEPLRVKSLPYSEERESTRPLGVDVFLTDMLKYQGILPSLMD